MSSGAAASPSASNPHAAGPSRNGLSEDEQRRFAAALARLGARPEAGEPLLLAVSGGPDSMAMLALAAATTPRGIAVATVDHGLRPEAADEATMVARHCARIGVPHATLTPAATIAGASLQAQAREARYEALGRHARDIGAGAVLTAHHADDAAETFLMRAARGSGLAGLAGVRERTTIAGATVLRPLLDWRRAELRAIVRRAGLPFVDDPANADERHDRTRFRRLLEANEWLDPPHLAQAAAQLAAVDADLRGLVDWAWARAEVQGATVRIAVADLPRELRRRLVRRAIAVVREAAGIASPPFSDAVNVESLLDALEAGRRATNGGVVASPRGGTWRFAAAPARRTADRPR